MTQDATDSPIPGRDIFSVSRLNAEVRAVLEGSFPLLWVEGEISNLARPSSGHIYFSLKDANAQVRCAMFRMRRSRLRFNPENGQQVVVRARVGLYEGRGEFQLIIEHMEPAGAGTLQQQFEALKAKLAVEGLFDTANKSPLPDLPWQIGLITSPSGAAVHDVLTVLKRRYPAVPVLIYPVPVQGSGAAAEITAAIRLARQRADCDLLILTRGGGSLEDLAEFNDETLAREIFACEIPLISAVGHEVDFSIADFVADRRAPTPSAAAEMAVPDQRETEQRLQQLKQRIALQLHNRLSREDTRLSHLQHRLQQLHPARALEQRRQRIDELEMRLQQAMRQQMRSRTLGFQALGSRLNGSNPTHRLVQARQRLQYASDRLLATTRPVLEQAGRRLATAAASLNALSPLATLERGFAIVRHQGRVVQDASQLARGDQLDIRLARGGVTAEVVYTASKSE